MIRLPVDPDQLARLAPDLDCIQRGKWFRIRMPRIGLRACFEQAPVARSINREAGMKSNVGNADRVFRVIVGLALLSMIVLLKTDVRWFGLIGLVPLTTGLAIWCPLYSMLGLNTCPAPPKKR